MNEERAKAAFNIRELTYLLDGGEKSTLVSTKKNTICSWTDIDILKKRNTIIDERAFYARFRERSFIQNGRYS